MNTKNLKALLPSIMSAALACACNGSAEPDTIKNETLHRIDVSVYGNIASKAVSVSSSDEDKINTLQLFVIDAGGNVVFYKDCGKSSYGEVYASEGRKEIMALVNAPDFSKAKTRSDISGSRTRLTDNDFASFVMTGSVTADIGGEISVDIPVTRIISKVMLKKVTCSFTSDILATAKFIVESVYLINVTGDAKFSDAENNAVKSKPETWYSRLSADMSSPVKKFTYDAINTALVRGASYNHPHTLYCYPNFTEESSFDSSWCPRHTVLVMEATLDGQKIYYPMEMPVIGCNKCIIIDELVVTKRGSDEPYKPAEDSACSVNLHVVPWDVILQRTETI